MGKRWIDVPVLGGTAIMSEAAVWVFPQPAPVSNLVIAAIVYWNSTYIADAVAHLRSSGEFAPDDLVARTSPVGWGHIAFSGDFLWDRAARISAGRRPLNLARATFAA